MGRLRLLDLYCGAGIGTRGYARYFDLTGVDIVPQPDYPFAFVQADALEYLAQHGAEYDIIHASPQCPAYSQVSRTSKYRKEYPREIAACRALLQATGKPYIIENVEGARAELIRPVLLCGLHFPGLMTYRHRLFETYPEILLRPLHRPHKDKVPPAGKGRSESGFFSLTSGGIAGVTQPERFEAMGLPEIVTTNRRLNQGFAPQYCEWIGARMLELIGQA